MSLSVSYFPLSRSRSTVGSQFSYNTLDDWARFSPSVGETGSSPAKILQGTSVIWTFEIAYSSCHWHLSGPFMVRVDRHRGQDLVTQVLSTHSVGASILQIAQRGGNHGPIKMGLRSVYLPGFFLTQKQHSTLRLILVALSIMVHLLPFMDNSVICFTLGNSPEPSSFEVGGSLPKRRRRYLMRLIPMQILPISTPSLTCLRCPWPTCTGAFRRPQDLRRHILSFHLPCWIYCPTCFWRGDRCEDFNRHLKNKKCGPKPPREQYEIYNTKLVLEWILEDNVRVETAVRYALNFVQERALELGKAQEWRDTFGRRGKRTRRRYNVQRR
ncbi:hypothetical protein BJV78DRAFT_208054 [Lactifluus subvellereus]|nr:hypothetical protein BJV78DRAFT_208054 [Lactifluus subvellereus]